MISRIFPISCALLAGVVLPSASFADELKVFCTAAFRPAMADVAAMYGKATKTKVIVDCKNVSTNAGKVKSGEPGDVVMLQESDALAFQSEGKVTDAVLIAKAGKGVGVKQGAPKPDISTLDAFWRTLENSKAISLNNRGAAGSYFVKMLKEQGKYDRLEPKFIISNGTFDSERILREGKADLAVSQASEIAATPGLDLVGPFPDEVQYVTVIFGAVVGTSKNARNAQNFLHFIGSEPVQQLLKRKGLM